jgi:ectoine hydroxylase-related dioxygenase (phytanoyl-CoA dioxygenase family)
LAPKVVEFLHLLFERRALASQTLGFLRGSGQAAHQDTAYVNYSLPMQFVASWAALEDVVEGAGELFYYVGSHQIREFIYGGEFKGLNDAKRLGADRDIDDEAKKHIEDIRRQAEGMRMPKQRLMAKRGDVLLWHADLAHGGSPISTEHTRKSIVTHYCPAEVVPLYVERQPRAALKSHYGRAFYSTCYYSDIEPV